MNILSTPMFGWEGRRRDLADCERHGFLIELAPPARAEWRARLQWVALVDFMAEEKLLHGDDASLAQHFVVPRNPEALGVSWCEAWQHYVVAVHRYRKPKAILPDLDAHREMLLELGGNVFCLFPEVDWSLRRSIAHFGALDLFFTQLLELHCDLEQARCHIPLQVLSGFGLAPQDLLGDSCVGTRAYVDMMRYLFDAYLPTLRAEAAEFTHLQGLPRALELMRESCLQRHARIERAFRECGFDFVAAESVYWSEVEASCSVRFAAAS